MTALAIILAALILEHGLTKSIDRLTRAIEAAHGITRGPAA